MSRALLLALVLAGATAVAEPRTVSHTRTLEVAKALRDPTQASVTFPFATRSDEVLMAARLKLQLGKIDVSGIRGLEVLVNDERVSLITAEELAAGSSERVIEIASRFMSDRNRLILKLKTDSDGACATVSAGTLKTLLREAELWTEAGALPLANDLALLPLPFIDRQHDTAATLPIVFASEPTAERVRQAAIIASWFGKESGISLSFAVSVGTLPESNAIVLVDDIDAATGLGVPVPDGASVRMMNHPRLDSSAAKLLVVSGRDANELAMAVRNIAVGTIPLTGEVVRFDKDVTVPPAVAYAAPRWLPDGAVPFADYPAKPNLVHLGTAAGAISVPFRLPPDLWTWPAEYVELDLGYSQLTPPGTKPPRLDVELNGNFVQTLASLPPAPIEKHTRARLRLRAEQLRGFNELKVHVTYPGIDACTASMGEEVKVSLQPDSKLLLNGIGHFATLPDVARFVHDGFPFTRLADLGESALVLSNTPDPREIGSALSIVAHFASVTGAVGTRLSVYRADEFLAHQSIDKDVLVVGLPSTNTVLRRWAEHSPLLLSGNARQSQMPSQNNVALRLLSGRMGRSELARSNEIVTGLKSFAAVAGWESPARAGRAVVAVSATSADHLPAVANLQGFAYAGSRSGDLLVASGNQRWMFRIGPSRDVGELAPWTRVRWALAGHWLVLFPAVLIGAALLGSRVKSSLDQRIRERLHSGAKR